MMKKLFYFVLALGMVSCGGDKNTRTVTVTNPMQMDRADEAVVLTRAQLNPADDNLLPAVKDAAGNYVASQVDDIDGDGRWDELAFVADIEASETASFTVVWVKEADYPKFPARTNVRYGKMIEPGKVVNQTSDLHVKEEVYFINTDGYPYQMDGIGWENDKSAWRHYYDGRNNRDYFGKRTTDMVLDNVGIREDGTPGDTYHVWADWGRDIMSVGTSYGLGGLAAWVDDSRFVRFGRTNPDPVDVIDSTRYTLLVQGPVRSVFALDFYGWDIEGTKVNLRQEVTIWAGKYNYENKVIAPNLPANVQLMTGIVYNFNDMPLEEIDFDHYKAMATHDRQSYDKEFWMGQALILPKSGISKIFTSPDYIPESVISRTWCAVLDLDPKGEAVYKAYCAWEHENDEKLFQDRDYFMNLIRNEGSRMDNPVTVTVE